MLPESGTNASTGSISLIDSSFSKTTTAIEIVASSYDPGTGSPGIVLNNVGLTGVKTLLGQHTGQNITLSGDKNIDTWTLGHTYNDVARKQKFQDEYQVFRDSGLLGSTKSNLPLAPFFERPRPQYEGKSVGDFVSMKGSCKGELIAVGVHVKEDHTDRNQGTG